MGLHHETLRVIGLMGDRTVKAVFDIRSSHSVMRDDIARAIGELAELPEPKQLKLVVGRVVAEHGLFADVVIEDKRLLCSFMTAHDLAEEMVLGADFLRPWGIRLNASNHAFISDLRALRLKAPGMRVPRARRKR